MQGFAAAVLFLSLSTGAWAQIAPSTAAATPVPLRSGASSGAPVTPMAPSAVAARAKKPKLFDRSFAWWTGASFAATVADIESTQHGISSCGAVELNPMLGSKPNRARLSGIGMPMTAGYDLLGLWMKRRWPHRRLWMLLPGSVTVVHAGAAAHNWALCP